MNATWAWPIAFALSLLVTHVNSFCYFPDGTQAHQNTPCDDTSRDSTCCGQGYACLSNNLCKATGDEIQRANATMYVRGSCTDQTWKSSSCPNFCADETAPYYDSRSGGQGVGKCENTNEDIYYCIDHNTKNVNCQSKENILSFQGIPTTVTVVGRPGSSSTSRVSPTDASQSPTTSQPNQSNPTGSSTSQDTGPTNNPAQPTAGSSSVTGIAVGASIGGVAFTLLVLGAVYLYRRRRAAAAAIQTTGNQAQYYGGAMKPEENPALRTSELHSNPAVVAELTPHQSGQARYELPYEPYHPTR